MKLSTRLCILHLLITLSWVETNTTTGLRKHHVEKIQNQVGISGKRKNRDRADNRIVDGFTHGGNIEEDHDDVKRWKKKHNKSHLQSIIGGKRTPCEGTSCLWNTENVVKIKRKKLTRNRRTESVFLAKALDLLDHSKPRELWNFATRATPNKPYKQFSNGTGTSQRSSNSSTTLVNKPVKTQEGNKRQQWSDVESEMRPRFFFNSAPAEFVEQKPPSLHRLGEEGIHLALPHRHGPLHAPGRLHEMGPFFHGVTNHLHMVKHPGHLASLPMNFLGHPIPPHMHDPLNLHNHHHMHHFDPPPPYAGAIHINAPPRLEPPMPPNFLPPPLSPFPPKLEHPSPADPLPQPLPPVDVPPPVPPDMLGEQMPPLTPPLGGEPLPPDVHTKPPPDILVRPNPPIDAPITQEPMPPDFSTMPPPDNPVPSSPIDIQGMPPPGDLTPMPPPSPTEKFPFPVPVPSPPRVEHVPYPVPVPGPPSIQPVVVPIHVPSPPKIEEIRVPVPSPPKINNVPVPFPVAVPSPPQVQHVPYPVALPIREPPQVQKIFYPVAVPQPSRVQHVPYPVYIRYPPEIKRVPYPVPSPPKPYPVPVPSPPRVMVHRVAYPVMYSQKVPYPVPVVVDHHHFHQEVENGEGNNNLKSKCSNRKEKHSK